jgi:hypothetical protein
MRLPKLKPADPISTRQRALNAEIAALEAEIRRLDAKIEANQDRPRLRSTARPSGTTEPGHVEPPAEPVFERVDHHRVTFDEEPDRTPVPCNELGVRKYDLAGAWRRIQQHFRGPAASNPRLINYLAAGSIQGLRPLRYEKRVARNRVLALAFILFMVLWGIIAVLLKR